MPVRLEGLRTVIYPAPDLAAAKAWWTTILAAWSSKEEVRTARGWPGRGIREVGIRPVAT